MVKTVIAYTYEVDEPEIAASEILEQLNLQENLLANAAGILSCHAEFIESGVVEAVCARLPFPVAGITTLASGSNEATDMYILTLCMLTSDDVSFAAGLTESLAEEQDSRMQAAYESTVAGLPDTPSLILAYMPMLNHVGGERLLKLLDGISGQAPIFGTLTCDHRYDFCEAQTIFNGQAYTESMAFIAMSGPINSRFFTVSVPDAKIHKQKAIITSSQGNVIMEINNKPVLDFLEDLGLSREDGLEGAKAIPIMLDYQDGTQAVARCFYLVTPEGHVVCGGDMPVNATFALCSFDNDDVLVSAGQLLKKIAEENKGSGMLIVSCIGRSVTLGVERLAEAHLVQRAMEDIIPYQLMYSGGEICPVYAPDGVKTANRFHNFSFNVCLF